MKFGVRIFVGQTGPIRVHAEDGYSLLINQCRIQRTVGELPSIIERDGKARCSDRAKRIPKSFAGCLGPIETEINSNPVLGVPVDHLLGLLGEGSLVIVQPNILKQRLRMGRIAGGGGKTPPSERKDHGSGNGIGMIAALIRGLPDIVQPQQIVDTAFGCPPPYPGDRVTRLSTPKSR
jgi:hypothetical protein